MGEQEVEIRSLDGESTRVRVKAEETVAGLKKLLQQHPNSSPFHLFLRGMKLSGGKSVQSLALREDDFVVLMPYSRGKQAAVTPYHSNLVSIGPECIGNGGVFIDDLSSLEDKNILKESHDMSSCKEVEDVSQQNREFGASSTVPDSVWNEIAADLSQWKAADFSNDSGQTSLNEPPEVKEQEQGGCNKRKRGRKSWSCPAVLERLHEIYRALNLVYGFLQKQHMQGTWQNMKTALHQLCGTSNEEIKIEEIETLASLFPKLVQISCRSGKGESESFNIDLLDPSKVPQDIMPRSLHEVMPFELQKGIGPSDLLPSAGVKQITDTVIKSSMQKRLSAFEASATTLMECFQAAFLKQKPNRSKTEMTGYTLEDLLQYANKSALEARPDNKPLPRPPRFHKKLARCMDTVDLSAAEMLEHLRQGLGSLGQIVHCEAIEKREAEYGQLAITLSDSTVAAMKKLHVTRFYKHQAEAINAAISKRSVIIATSTASGKSVCYNVPVLEELSSNPESCALYLFPTKALAQDQYRALVEMTSGLNAAFSLGVYDGDTPQHLRLHLRDHARLFITNPDMLHVSILPSHRQFERLLSNLRYVVVDEAHAYRGAFGCHTAVILRRLRRLCHHLYGTDPTFIVSSATVANPREHAMELIGLRTIEVVQEDGSPCGKKYFLLWDPPMYYTTGFPSKGQDNHSSKNDDKQKQKDKKQLLCKRARYIFWLS